MGQLSGQIRLRHRQRTKGINMLGQTTNKMLQQVEQQTESKVDPTMLAQFHRIVNAGLKVMYSDQSHHLMAQELAKPGDPTEVVGEGVAKLMVILFKEGKHSLPMKAMMPATVVLCCEALDFAEKSGKLTVDNNAIAATVQEAMSTLLQALGVSPDRLQSMMSNQQQAGPSAAPAQPQPAPPPAPQAPAPAQPGIINGQGV